MSLPETTTPAQAANAMMDLITYWNATRVEWSDAMRGPADGGPNGDGFYPLILFDGSTILVPSVAKLEQIGAAVPADLETAVSDLDHAAQAEVTENLDTIEVVARLAPDQPPKRVAPFMFASRRTQDLSVLPDSDYADWVQVIASSGDPHKVRASTFMRSIANVIDPALPPYNVKFDAQKVYQVGFSSGGHVLTAPFSVFSANDNGKLGMVSNGAPPYAGVGYVKYIDATHVGLYSDAALTVPLSFGATKSAEEFVWGTDCTAAMQQAFDDAEPSSRFTYGKVVVLGGMTMATHLEFGSIAVVGLSATGCGFYAIPVANDTRPFFRDKVTGNYATWRADSYTIRNLTIHGQKYTNLAGCFRNAFQINGGAFANFVRGAPYAVIEGLSVFEGVWNNIVCYNAFAGSMNNILSLFAAQVGIRNGFWDLNGQNWHAEGNGGAGIWSLMAGGNVNTIRSSYNGVSAGTINSGGAYWPDEMGANFTEAGRGNSYTNLRCQESWSHNLCVTSYDPLSFYTGGGAKNTFNFVTLDDTADITPTNTSASQTRFPTSRAMIAMIGNLAVNNTINFASGAGQVKTTNYATNGYFDRDGPTGNKVTLDTPGISNAPADWYSGQSAASPGPWYTTAPTSIAARGNSVSVNGAAAP